jgi:nucleoside-diphosphate kinase
MPVETTLVLVKPDGVRRGLCGAVVGRLERKGYELRGARLHRITKTLAREHYVEH